ncbi:MAG: peptidase C2, partial [Frankia sp.]|nr:peptidase C2 [Frankia sp.]
MVTILGWVLMRNLALLAGAAPPVADGEAYAAAAAELRRLASAVAGLLDPVAELDQPRTWLGPWPRRAGERIDGWRRAVGLSADLLARRSRWCARAAEALAEPAWPAAAGLATAVAADWPRAPGPGETAGPCPGQERGAGVGARAVPWARVPVTGETALGYRSLAAAEMAAMGPVPGMAPGWDVPDPALVRVLGLGLAADAADGPADPYAGGLPGPGRPAPAPRPDAYGAARDIGGGLPVAFDPDRLAALAGRLRAAAGLAAELAVAIALAEWRVTSHAAGGSWLRPAARVTVPGLAVATDVLRLGPHVVAAGAPVLAGEVERRMAHFAAAEEAVRAGRLWIDRRAWFADAPPPAVGAVGAAAAELARLIGRDPGALTATALRTVGERLAGLTQAARQAVLGELRGEPLRVLTESLTRLTWHGGVRSPAPDAALLALPDLLLASVPTALVDDLVRLLPALEPALPDGWRTEAASGGGEPLVRDGPASSDVGQGALGDCYLAAVLIAIARARPEAIGAGLRENPNGTVTVTLFRNGRPFPVTVTRDLPARGLGLDSRDLAGRPELWAALYEKAFARAHGGAPRRARGPPAPAPPH